MSDTLLLGFCLSVSWLWVYVAQRDFFQTLGKEASSD